MFLFAIALSS